MMIGFKNQIISLETIENLESLKKTRADKLTDVILVCMQGTIR